MNGTERLDCTFRKHAADKSRPFRPGNLTTCPIKEVFYYLKENKSGSCWLLIMIFSHGLNGRIDCRIAVFLRFGSHLSLILCVNFYQKTEDKIRIFRNSPLFLIQCPL
jgi:hypothetical protein